MPLDVAQLGQVFTPPNIVAFMLDLCRNKGRVLEPSAGDGAFFDTLRQRGAEVVGIEIDRSVAPQGAQVGDFFAYPLDEPFDTIVGNPPYVRYQDVARETKQHLHSELCDARSNLFLFFIEKAVRHLKPGGAFLIKLFQGTGFDVYVRELRRRYEKVVIRKPDASRKRSPEVYALGQGKLAKMK